mmetsp:Transcript_12309/g.18482  ORF Transcript_12309/g.18482 Transcript_12309/m.18482 type:complete len:95 (+) Transcript_12309:115-399(+)
MTSQNKGRNVVTILEMTKQQLSKRCWWVRGRMIQYHKNDQPSLVGRSRSDIFMKKGIFCRYRIEERRHRQKWQQNSGSASPAFLGATGDRWKQT